MRGLRLKASLSVAGDRLPRQSLRPQAARLLVRIAASLVSDRSPRSGHSPRQGKAPARGRDRACAGARGGERGQALSRDRGSRLERKRDARQLAGPSPPAARHRPGGSVRLAPQVGIETARTALASLEPDLADAEAERRLSAYRLFVYLQLQRRFPVAGGKQLPANEPEECGRRGHSEPKGFPRRPLSRGNSTRPRTSRRTSTSCSFLRPRGCTIPTAGVRHFQSPGLARKARAASTRVE
jgi:hypothetical protein